jgi:hypothetical protein
MTRPSRRSGLLLLAALGGLFGAGLGTLAWAVEQDPPTVTFGSVGACSTRPDVTSIEVIEGTSVQFVNDTGSDASAMVGSLPVLDEPLPHGGAVVLTLAPGQHEVRMDRGCGNAQPVTVLVTPAAVPSLSPTASTVPSPEAHASPGALPTPPPAPSGSTGPAPRASPRASSVITVVRGGVEPVPSSLAGYAGPVVAATRVEPPGAGNPKAVRLLAAVATICVLGVTAAVIRSIVRLSP